MTSSAKTATMAVSNRLSDKPNGAGLLLRSATCTLPGEDLDDCVGTPIAALSVDVDDAGGGPTLLGVGVGCAGGGTALLEPARCWIGWPLGAVARLDAKVSGLLLGNDGLAGGWPLVCDSGKPGPDLVGVCELLVVTGAVEVGAPLEDDGGQVVVLLGCGCEPVPVGGQDFVLVTVAVSVLVLVLVAL
jgi:hypothetical protein